MWPGNIFHDKCNNIHKLIYHSETTLLMIAVEHLMARKKLKTILKRSIDKNNMDIFTDYIIKEKDSIKEIYDLEISTMLYDALKNIEISDGLYEALLSIDNKSILVLEERALKLYREGEVDAFITFIASNKYLLDQDKVKKF
jgi:hypothetical protein